MYDHDTSRMQEAEITYFRILLASQLIEISEDILSSIPSLVTHHKISSIMTIPTREEIKDVIFSMSKNRAHGPDDFSTDFYSRCWDIVGTDLLHVIKEFFPYKVFPRSWKATFIARIPKVVNPTFFKDFRPISLCNVCYKVVSKIITARLSVFLDRLISPE
ncbi:unnamed protein product [Spirodela intermedia]|uniref:Uncharacterized protein n=1 Tax=Spirodela intermedia TaxID=51605 RepID=A0A7I8JQK4_SPIIN|nr:unnamed protein product [Spirodela intermedia]CAA2632917.1 unnamed protein product [Spirodela intermedia]CAA2632922.1 unnamed protein product [Spirodela intermedia]CAA6672065.1 unnamed protein product [Spirodela intermedia]CAA6672067.1 unnamed protein product [Spirodela intermedia]